VGARSLSGESRKLRWRPSGLDACRAVGVGFYQEVAARTGGQPSGLAGLVHRRREVRSGQDAHHGHGRIRRDNYDRVEADKKHDPRARHEHREYPGPDAIEELTEIAAIRPPTTPSAAATTVRTTAVCGAAGPGDEPAQDVAAGVSAPGRQPLLKGGPLVSWNYTSLCHPSSFSTSFSSDFVNSQPVAATLETI
jgi:hypothetical protein